MRWTTGAVCAAAALFPGCSPAPDTPEAPAVRDYPIIDAHLHALPAAWNGPPPQPMCMGDAVLVAWDGRGSPNPTELARCERPIPSALSDEELMVRTLEIMERENVIGVTSGPLPFVERWREAAPDRILPAVLTSFVDTPVDTLRAYVQSGRIMALGEVTSQYAGLPPDAPELEPYWALAEELQVPVGIHMGLGPPGMTYLGPETFRVRAGDPARLEEVLAKHPRLRVYVMHAAYPREDVLMALMYAYPQLYAGIGVLGFVIPRAAFHALLRRFVEAGFEERVLFGSDQMVWPEALEASMEAVETAAFLTPEQKRAILHDNAARFFRLDGTSAGAR